MTLYSMPAHLMTEISSHEYMRFQESCPQIGLLDPEDGAPRLPELLIDFIVVDPEPTEEHLILDASRSALQWEIICCHRFDFLDGC